MSVVAIKDALRGLSREELSDIEAFLAGLLWEQAVAAGGFDPLWEEAKVMLRSAGPSR